jgi:YD repeat-containing protein
MHVVGDHCPGIFQSIVISSFVAQAGAIVLPNRTEMLRLLLSLLLCVCLTITNAQNYSVNYSTGTVSASIPLFSVSDGDVNVPVTLFYSASGVKLDDDDGWLGNGWALSAQSYGVTRVMRGLPDDLTESTGSLRQGWLYSSLRGTIQSWAPTTDNNITTCTTGEVTTFNFLNALDYKNDTEPDVFNISAPGLSVKFYFDETRTPRTVPYDDVIITAYTASGAVTSSSTPGAITYFTVKDARGFTYQFNEVESTSQSLFSSNNDALARRSKLHLAAMTYTTSWKLTSIVSPVYGTVTFEYKTITLSSEYYKYFNPMTWAYHHYKYQFPIAISGQGGCGVGANLDYSRSSVIKVLTKISSPIEEATFSSSPKNANTLLERLDAIYLIDKRSGVNLTKKSYSVGVLNVTGEGTTRSLVQSVAEYANQTINGVTTTLVREHKFIYKPGPGNMLPTYNSDKTDDWGFYKATDIPFDETVASYSLERIEYPEHGFTAFLYEPHAYWNGTANVMGGGIRIRRIVNHDGVSSSNDQITEFEYVKADGATSSGKVQYIPQYTFFAPNGCLSPYKSTESLGYDESLLGSAIAYERVRVRQKNEGSTVYEYDLPASWNDASANANEWQASKVDLARSSTCTAAANVELGINKYPFPPNPNYEFARGLLTKVTAYKEGDIVKVSETTNTYQRIYRGSSIRKIYALALEEVKTPTPANVKMFLYSKYEINTEVKTELASVATIDYQSDDLSRFVSTTTNYYYESPQHKELTRIKTTGSDMIETHTVIRYVADFTIGTNGDAASLAIKNLQTANRKYLPVETYTYKLLSPTNKFINGNLNIYQIINSKAYPYKSFSFNSTDGITLTPSTATGPASMTTFNWDQTNYVLQNTITAVDSYGNVKSNVGRNRVDDHLVTSYNGSLPVLKVTNAKLGEVRYSDFETTHECQFAGMGSGTSGRYNSKSYALAAYPAGVMQSNVVLDKPGKFIFTTWIKNTSSGALTLSFYGSSSVDVIVSIPPGTGTWKQISKEFTLPTTLTNAALQIKSSQAVELDDMFLHPDHAVVSALIYKFPFGVWRQEEPRGTIARYDYDALGRVSLVYDRDGNIIKKIDYQTKP